MRSHTDQEKKQCAKARHLTSRLAFFTSKGVDMHTPTTQWDRPPTDKELHSFYGNVPTVFEVNEAIDRHTSAIDKDDLTEVCHEFEADILAAIRGKNAAALMAIFQGEINKAIARRASISVYGDAHVIPADRVAW